MSSKKEGDRDKKEDSRGELEKLLDDTGRRLLHLLQKNARLSFTELGRSLSLTPPAIAERMRRLEETGVIEGYRAEVNPARLGFGLTVFIRLVVPATTYPRIIALARELPEVRECHHVMGGDSFIMKVIAPDVTRLEELIARFSPFGQTTTALVLSSPVTPADKPPLP